MLLRYLRWHYGRGLRSVFAIAANFLAFAFHLFSVRELADSFFAPWKQISFSHRGGILTAQALEALWGNVLSRVLGAMARSTLIILGVFAATIIALADALLVVLWLIAPALPALSFFLGFRLLR